MPDHRTKQRRYAGLEKSLRGFLEEGEHLQHQCTALTNDSHAALFVERRGELISAVISDRALYFLFNSRRPPEATRVSFDELKRFEQTSYKTVMLETYGDTDYILAPQSLMVGRTTRKFMQALSAWAPNRVVAKHRINLLPDGKGATLFQLTPGPMETGMPWSWSISFDLELLNLGTWSLQEEAKRRSQEIIERVQKGA
ncbi:hypothetical protein AB1388_11440 [Streptomyces hydrogenans]|uniref:hypothetical protein n=1 Tax=Streptomyces hydrogenans TaxID=1873719 RepID=UPI00345D12AA